MTIPLALLILLLPTMAIAATALLRRFRFAETASAIAACLLAAGLLAAANPSVSLGPLQIDAQAPLNLLGRMMRIRPHEQVGLILLFVCVAGLFAVSWRAQAGRTFVTTGLIALVLAVAAILIRPFSFSAIFLFAAAAVLALMIQAEHVGASSTQGATRLLATTLIALPGLLGAAFLLEQAGRTLDQATLDAAHARISAFFVIGSVMALGAFPPYTWKHLVAREAPALVTGFVSTVLSSALTFGIISFRQENPWFAESDAFGWLRGLGIACILFGGALAWAQRAFGRVLACALMIDTGCTLLLLHANSPSANAAIAIGLPVRAASIAVLALGLGILRASRENDDFDTLRGLFNAGPSAKIATFALAIGGLSLAGAPATFGFVQSWLRIEAFAATNIEVAALFVIASGSVGLGVLRGISSMLDNTVGAPQHQSLRLRRVDVAGVLLACTALLVLGVAPGWPASMAQAFASGLVR